MLMAQMQYDRGDNKHVQITVHNSSGLSGISMWVSAFTTHQKKFEQVSKQKTSVTALLYISLAL